MPFSSPFPALNIPKFNLLEYLFPEGSTPSDTPLWIDSKETNHHLTPRTLLQWTKRLALGLDRIGSKPGEVVMILTPNHIFVPVAYLGIVGSKRIFSGANPAYTVSGAFQSFRDLPGHCMLTMIRNATPSFKHTSTIYPRSSVFSQDSSRCCERGRSSSWPRLSVLRRAKYTT